jgi:hypothetical protein
MKKIIILFLFTSLCYGQNFNESGMTFIGKFDDDDIYIKKVNVNYNEFTVFLKFVINPISYEYEAGKYTTIDGSASLSKIKFNCGMNTYDIYSWATYRSDGTIIMKDDEKSFDKEIFKDTIYEIVYKYLCSD